MFDQEVFLSVVVMDLLPVCKAVIDEPDELLQTNVMEPFGH